MNTPHLPTFRTQRCADPIDRATAAAQDGDFSVTNHGAICLVALNTDAARCWVSENVGGEPQYWAGRLVVEPRYLADLVAGMESAGLTQN